jgi:hypothetical protein
MTLATRTSRHDEKKLAVYVILISCFGMFTAIMISILYGPITVTGPSLSPLSPPSYVDFGSTDGFVMSSDGSPINGATVHGYKHMALPDSADRDVGYSTSVLTDADGSYKLSGLPSSVYKLTVTYPDGAVQSIDNYAIWPSSSSSYNISLK